MAHMGFPKTRGSFPGFPQGLQVLYWSNSGFAAWALLFVLLLIRFLLECFVFLKHRMVILKPSGNCLSDPVPWVV